jgi:trimeric autotransporter adhesin
MYITSYSRTALLIFRLTLLGLTTCLLCLAQGVNLGLSSGSGAPGTAIPLAINLSAPSNDPPASVEWTINYSNTDFSSVSVQVGSAAAGANKSISCTNSPGIETCVIYGLNDAPISNGVVATVSLTLSSSTTAASSVVQMASGSASDLNGVSITTATAGATVGISPPALNGFSCNPISLTAPASSTCSVALTSAANSGGAVIAISAAPAAATVPASITIPQGSSSATFSATATAVTIATAVTLTASYAGASETFNLTISPPPPTLSSISVPAAINSGQSAAGSVTLSSAAGASGAIVSLVSSNPAAASVPQSVTVPAGALSAGFSVNAGSVTTPTSVVFTASYSGASRTANVTINPLPAALSSVSIAPSTVVSGQAGTGTVTLSAAAPTGGVVVSLSSSNPAAASVPASATIAQGATSATFSLTAGTVSTATVVTVTASYSGVSRVANVTINPPTPVLSGISIPSQIPSGQSGTGTVSLTTPAGSGGVVVALSSSNPQAASVATSVMIPQGSQSATFSITAGQVSTSTTVTVSASYSGVSQTASTTVNPLVVALSSVSVNPVVIASGQTGLGTVILSAPAGSNGVVIALLSSDKAANVPSTVTVPQGATTATFQVNAKPVNVTTSVILTASYSGVTVTTSLTVSPRHRASLLLPFSQYSAGIPGGPPNLLLGEKLPLAQKGDSLDFPKSGYLNLAVPTRLRLVGLATLPLPGATGKEGWSL